MNPPAKIERQRVYLAYRELFSGNNAFVRHNKVILSIIKASQIGTPLTGQRLKRKTVPILRSLLNDRVFELEEQARKEFPELWLNSSQDRISNKTLTEHTATPEELVKHEKTGHGIHAESLPHTSLHGMSLI